VARTIDKACQLVEAGYEYLCNVNNMKVFRKKKRPPKSEGGSSESAAG